jgi:hypothetical protein
MQIIILPEVLYGCETWSLTLREEQRLTVFESRVLRSIFWPKRDRMTGRWRIMHDVALRYLYSSSRIIRMTKSRRMRWSGHVARMEEGRNTYKLLVEKPEGKRPLEDRGVSEWLRLRWILESRMGWCGQDWSGSEQGQMEGSCEFSIEPRVPWNAGRFSSGGQSMASQVVLSSTVR